MGASSAVRFRSQRSPGRRLLALLGTLIGTAALAVWCLHTSSGASGHAPAGRITASVVRGGVQVTVVVSADKVAVTYRPQWPGFHLYSITLPKEGIDGLGVPTQLTVQGGLRAAGPPTSDQPVRMLELQGLDVRLPVYPDGPVTITLPVTRTGSPTAQIVVSYGACSTRTCLVPVTALVIPIQLG